MEEKRRKVGFMFTWKIKNFSLCSHTGDDRLISPLFRIEMLGNSEWQLWLYPRRNNEVVLTLFRPNNDKGPQKVPFDVELFLFKKNCPPVYTEDSKKLFGRNTYLIKYLSVPIDKIFNEKELFLPEDTLTVRCRLWNTTTKNVVKCNAVTQISMEKYQISLPMCYFSDVIFLSPDEIRLKSMSRKYPDFKISCTKPNENLDFEVHAIEPLLRTFVRCELSIQRLNCSKIVLFQGDHWFEPENKKWTLSDIFKSVIPDMKRSGNNSYKIEINLFASDATEYSFFEGTAYYSAISESNEIIQKSSEYLLPKQFEKIYLEEKFTDFTIKSGKREFKIHKAIFGAVSPVFAIMFETNMKEKKDSSVTINDIDSDILEKMVHYIYTGKIVDVEWVDAVKLYAAADKYQITDFKQTCTGILTSKMNAENVGETLILADLHQDEMVVNAAKQLIRENATQVFRSDKWRSVMENYPKIACEVMHEILTL